MRFWTFLHDSLGHTARWHSKRFVLCPQRGASEHCSWKRIYLLSVRMNKAFHHLAAVLDWASDETPPSLAFCSPSGEAVGPLVWCRTLKKNKKQHGPLFFPPVIFLLLRHFWKSLCNSYFLLKASWQSRDVWSHINHIQLLTYWKGLIIFSRSWFVTLLSMLQGIV